MTQREKIHGGLLGSLVGDALGVPVEFHARRELDARPVTGLRGHGTHDQPAGTWSDDGALLLCTTEALLAPDPDLEHAARLFHRWLEHGHWAVGRRVFDVGHTTRAALGRIAAGVPAMAAGATEEHQNGNGALMRILPVALRHGQASPGVIAREAMRWSMITHRHPRSQLACAYHGLLVRELLGGAPPAEACRGAGRHFEAVLAEHPEERDHFSRLMEGSLASVPRGQVASSTYVLDALEAACWCLLQGGNFREIVLRAVNLGDDTDTIGSLAGGLAGVWLGARAIPDEWAGQLATDPPYGPLLEDFARLVAAD